MVARYSRFIASAFLLCLLSLLAAPARADMPGQWVSDSTGNPITVPTQRYTVDHFFDLTTSVGFNGLNFTADVGHLLFNASLTTPAYSPTPVSWSSPLNWDNPIIPLAWYQNSIQHAQNGDVLGVSTSGNTDFYPISSFDALIHGGPTATEVSVPIPLPLPPEVTFNLGTRVAFNVTINGSRTVQLDQNATLETLIIDSGSFIQSLSAKTLTVNGPLINNGQLSLSGPTSAQYLTNAGQITIASGGSLGTPSPFANDGILTIGGGSFSANGVTNYGTITWSDGSLNSGGINNTSNGLLMLTGSGSKDTQPNAMLTNSGTIIHSGNGSVLMDLGTTLRNSTGAVYDLQGDGGIGFASYTYGGTATINNAGTFRKSGGTGVSSIGFYTYSGGSYVGGVDFNNTGTIEVDSGTLSLGGGGSSTDGSFVFANGGCLEIANGVTFSGTNTGTGNGLLDVTGSLGPMSGQTTTLSFVGGSEIRVSGSGRVGGGGSTINIGRFEWAGGSIDGGTGGFANNSNAFTVTGVADKHLSNGTLTNAGNITHGGTGSLLMDRFTTLTNLAGAVYDLQGDGGIGFASYAYGGSATINNAGTFRKSGGTGVSSIGFYTYNGGSYVGRVEFNNTGTIEVDSGTLSLGGGGSSTNGSFVFANGGCVEIANGFSFSGTNTGAGNGLLEVTGSLGPVSGQTTTLSFTGGSAVRVSGAGLVGGGGSTINAGKFDWAGGAIDGGTGGFVNNSNAFTVTGVADKHLSKGTVTNAGTITHSGTGSILMDRFTTLTNAAGAVYDLQVDGGIGFASYVYGGSATINNAGMFRKSGGTGVSSIGFYTYNGGSYVGGVVFNNAGTVDVDSGTISFDGGFTQSSGVTNLNGGNIAFNGAGQFQGGVLTGSGTITGSVSNAGAVVSPGHSPGVIAITGDYTQSASGTLLIELAGKGNDQYDILDVDGKAYLGGTLEIGLLNGFRPAIGDTFHIMDFNSRAGSFASIQVLGSPGYQFAMQYSGDDLTLLSLPHFGDANKDDAVDVVDLGVLAKNYDTAIGATWTMGDFNNDGAVNVVDLGILAQNYDWAGAPAPRVPEPMAMSLLALGGIALLRRHR